MATISEFIAQHGITMTVERVDSNPNMDQDDWTKDSSHWRCVLHMNVGTMPAALEIPFSQGSALTTPPTAEDVLDCLVSDASSVDNTAFDDWAEEMGYDTDSRKAERTYNAIVEQTVSLRNMLGEDAFNELVWTTDRL